jgi:hypothetical protein
MSRIIDVHGEEFEKCTPIMKSGKGRKTIKAHECGRKS